MLCFPLALRRVEASLRQHGLPDRGCAGAHQHQLEVLRAAGGGEYQERAVGVLILPGQSGLAVAHGLGDWRVGSGGQSGR